MKAEIPWVTPKDMKVWEISDAIDKITEEAVRSSATNLVPSGSVLLVNRSGILKHTLPVGITRRPVAINQDIKALICGKHAHPDYIARVVQAAEPVILGWVRATTADNFPIDNLRRLPIPLPPLAEQKRIAAILDQADALRRLRRRALDRLNTLGQAIFQEMFGSAEHLPMVALDALTSKIGSGVTPRGGDAAYLENGTPLIRSMNVRDGFFSAEGLAYISDLQARVMKGVTVRAGDVLLNITGASVARTCLAPSMDREARVNQHVAIIRPKPGLSAQYLCSYLALPSTNATLLNMAEIGATRQALTKSQISDLRIPLPCTEEQEAYTMRLKAVDAVSAGHERCFVAMDSLFASLQHRAFAGQL